MPATQQPIPSPTWSEIPVHVLDFEGSVRTGVIEYGIATLHRGEIVATHTRLCAPLASVPPKETRCHGLRDTDLANAGPFSENWGFFAEMRRTGFFCAHHVSTEQTLLKATWPYPGAMPDHAHPGEFLNAWDPWLDTHHLARVMLPDLPDHKLENLVQHFSLGTALVEAAENHCPPRRRKYHCALYDALAAALLLQRLVGIFHKNHAAPPSVEQLVLASLPPARQQHRIQGTLDFFQD
ncbi:MAG: 3'-5' exonuclease [Puniceicoccales bacterium]|jgi:DNA polymerase-3 subunit epsilon|nr:3'-5' exonuclease [Puniceicoccales bacterium]